METFFAFAKTHTLRQVSFSAEGGAVQGDGALDAVEQLGARDGHRARSSRKSTSTSSVPFAREPMTGQS